MVAVPLNCEDLEDVSKTVEVTLSIVSPLVGCTLSQNYHREALYFHMCDFFKTPLFAYFPACCMCDVSLVYIGL